MVIYGITRENPFFKQFIYNANSTHSTVPDLKVGVWTLNEAEALNRKPSGLPAGRVDTERHL
jgi:hypothetical protein